MDVARDGAVLEPGIVYGRGGGRDLALDVLRPEAVAGEARPLVLWVHGGGWRSGSRADPPTAPLVARGVVTASASYRLSAEAIFPAQIHDVTAAIRFLRANAARWNVDPDRIGIWGHSAGAHLAALAAATADTGAFAGEGGNVGVSGAVRAVVALAPPTVFLVERPLRPHWPAAFDLLGGELDDPAVRERARLASPQTHVGAGAPPLLVVHGDADTAVPIADGRSLVAAWREAGAEARLVEVPGEGHDLPSVFGTMSDGPLMARIVAFFAETLGPVAAADGGRR